MPSIAGHHVDKNPAFEALHPRDRSGKDRGQFVDVPGMFKMLGGIWDGDRGVWLVPQSNRHQLKQALDEIGFDLLHVPKGMRPMREEDREKRFGPNTKIPPAWTDVFVSDDPEAPVQVVGRDRKGIKQRIQSVAFSEEGAAAKFARVRHLDQHIDEVDTKLSEEAVKSDTAATAMLVRKMGLRPSSPKILGDVKTYGATNLERRHVKIRGDTVFLDFIGKEGIRNRLELEDAELAKVLKKRIRGKQGGERLWKVNDRRLNRWFKENAFGTTSKDFRTRLATAEARRFLQDFDAPENDKEARFQQLRTGEHVSKILGNTREQALESYIDPSVFETNVTSARPDELHVGMRIQTRSQLAGTINRIEEELVGEGDVKWKSIRVVVDLDNGTKETFAPGFIDPAPNLPPPKPQIHQSGHAPGTILVDKDGAWHTVLSVDQRAADVAAGKNGIWVKRPDGIHDIVPLDKLITGEEHDAKVDAELDRIEAETVRPWARGNALRTHDHAVQAGEFRYQQLLETPEMREAQRELDEATKAKDEWTAEHGEYPSIEDWVKMSKDWTFQQKRDWDDEQRPGQEIRGRHWRAKRDLEETRQRVFKNELQRRRVLAPKGTMETRELDDKPGTARIARQIHHAASKLPETWIKKVGKVGAKHHGGRGEWNGRRILSRNQSVTMHELGHAIEERNPAIHGLVTEFFLKRIHEAGKRPVRLNETEPGSNYRDSEVHFPGMFPDNYTSKWYGGNVHYFVPEDLDAPRSTEILSMGLQNLFYKESWAKDPWDEDPEFRNFLLGLLFDHDRTDAEKDLDLSADAPDPNLPQTTNTGNQGTFRAIVANKEVDARLIRYAPDGDKVYVEANGRKTWIDSSKIVTGARTEVTDPTNISHKDVTLEPGSKKGTFIAVSKNGTEVGRLTKQANGWAFQRADGKTVTDPTKEGALARLLRADNPDVREEKATLPDVTPKAKALPARINGRTPLDVDRDSTSADVTAQVARDLPVKSVKLTRDPQTQAETGYPWWSVTATWDDGTETHDQYEQHHDLDWLRRDLVDEAHSKANPPEPPKPPAAVAKPPDAPGGRPGAAERETMAKAFYAGFEEHEELTGGQMSLSVKRVTLSDGSMAVLKVHEWDGEARREMLANVVASAVGLDSNAIDLGDNRSLQKFVKGQVARDYIDSQPGVSVDTFAESDPDTRERLKILVEGGGMTFTDAGKAAAVLDLPGAREMGIMDFLIRNRDRHTQNWFVSDEGRVVPIDHGMVFFTPTGADRDIPRSPFSMYWAGHAEEKPSARAGFGVDPATRAKPSTPIIKEGDLKPRVSKAYLAELRARLELGKGEFTDEEWAGIIARLDMLTAAAPDTIEGEPPMEAMT